MLPKRFESNSKTSRLQSLFCFNAAARFMLKDASILVRSVTPSARDAYVTKLLQKTAKRSLDVPIDLHALSFA